MKDDEKPEWAPEDSGKEFAGRVKKGVHPPPNHQINPNPRKGRKGPQLSEEALVEGVLAGDRTILAKAITLIESNAAQHFEKAQRVIEKLIPHSGESIRVGITGAPGVGKSTFIEALGMKLCDEGHKVAVLAVDPSSTVSKGSILGDKTRMEHLARNPNAFIRPSPSGGTLGGVANKTRETIIACEASGFDIILVETVGVGQSEISVRTLVDFFLLLILPGSGDELQGIKKGVVELADALVVNKADGDFAKPAALSCSQYASVLHYFSPATPGWEAQVSTCSSITKDGIDDVWSMIERFASTTRDSGVFEQRRRDQSVQWIHTLVEDHLKSHFYKHPEVIETISGIEKAVLEERMSPAHAARSLLESFGKPD